MFMGKSKRKQKRTENRIFRQIQETTARYIWLKSQIWLKYYKASKFPTIGYLVLTAIFIIATIIAFNITRHVSDVKELAMGISATTSFGIASFSFFVNFLSFVYNTINVDNALANLDNDFSKELTVLTNKLSENNLIDEEEVIELQQDSEFLIHNFLLVLYKYDVYQSKKIVDHEIYKLRGKRGKKTIYTKENVLNQTEEDVLNQIEFYIKKNPSFWEIFKSQYWVIGKSYNFPMQNKL